MIRFPLLYPRKKAWKVRELESYDDATVAVPI